MMTDNSTNCHILESSQAEIGGDLVDMNSIIFTMKIPMTPLKNFLIKA